MIRPPGCDRRPALRAARRFAATPAARSASARSPIAASDDEGEWTSTEGRRGLFPSGSAQRGIGVALCLLCILPLAICLLPFGASSQVSP